MSAVLSTPPVAAGAAAAHFAARLAVEADVSDVHADLHAGVPGLLVVDSRSTESWQQGRIPGALHLPTREIAGRAGDLVPLTAVVVTYCWGPGCNGATRAALEFARLGYRVKEMIGGFEYWVREGFPVATDDGEEAGVPDPLTAPAGALACGC
ncbi:rhodanese-like domain-containing protein [Pseudonocardia sp. GCM10023141]|uniref:rhodanese-like domain-containing protein n=1 Tax=Pseudonocardia sp. GCM10023141 TaxID=3252653 RepID=UPI00360889A0